MKKLKLIFAIIIVIVLIGIVYNKSFKGYKEVRIHIGSTKQTLQAFLYLPNDNKKHDVVIFNHGSSGKYLKTSEPAELQAEYFVKQGYIVVVPMRKGKGTSDGVYLESEKKNPDINSWAPGINSALEDISSAIKYSIKLPNFKKNIIIAGSSRGGYLSVAYAAKGKYRKKIKAVINFVGAWVGQKQDNCPVDFNLVSFKRFGKLSNVPNIWLYGRNDMFNYDSSIIKYYKVFKASNKNTKFFLYNDVPENGHFLPQYKDIWESDLTNFLDKLKV